MKSIKSRIWIIYTTLFISFTAIGSATEFIFLMDDVDEMFGKCDNHHGNGLRDLADISDFQIELNDYSILAGGSAKFVWDVKPTDRIEFHLEVMKFKRGSWQPTVYNVIRPDLCPTLYSSEEIWYDAFTSKIKESTRACVNVKGAIVEMEALHEYLVFDTVNTADLEGRHKMEFHWEAYDEQNRRRPNDVCFQILGEFQKIKN